MGETKEETQIEYKLSELIELEKLQEIQDVFSSVTNMAVLITEADGSQITQSSGFTEYCMKYTKNSPLGRSLCEQCDRYGALQTMKTGKIKLYMCHSGLVDFSAPIVVKGQMIGCIIGGQVLLAEPDEKNIREIAQELSIDPDEYWESVKKVPICSRKDIDKASRFLYVMASTLSEMAYGHYLAKVAGNQIQETSSSKSDFLANMSHEIRTPMNAVIGMAEMALREEMSPAARDYIEQIKSSGRALLNIINDILDFSKIESGKMELSCVEYQPLSLLSDISAIVMTRLTNKPVELLLDFDSIIPHTLYGDDLRLRQVIINLANNATKFTQWGHVILKVRHERIDDENILLKVSITDTGIGIKPEDMKKLFNSFQQVDSKRNRNIEGTGLGLAISRDIVTLMGGNIGVESEYEKGSTFYFEVPQRVVEDRPSIELENPGNYAIAGFFEHEDVGADFRADSTKLGVMADILNNVENPVEIVSAWLERNEGKKSYVVFEESIFDEEIVTALESSLGDAVHPVMLAGAFSDVKKYEQLENLQIIRKPLSVLTLTELFEQENVHLSVKKADSDNDAFIAPQARILIVDDNAINLTVAEGLLEPLKMQVDTATSGAEALGKLASEKYDIVFMDHMMPEMDGVETTRVIRRMYPECNNMPIIALTANAVSGTKEMFLSEGMNDFVSKPIEVAVLISKVRQWLPMEKIKAAEEEADKKTEEAADGIPEIPERMGDLDLKAAMGLIGSKKLFWKIFKEYYRVIDKKSDLITRYYEEENWANYVVEVHALKSASKQIGAMELSQMAADLEAAGNAREIDKIKASTKKLVARYLGYKEVLAPYFEESSDGNAADRPEIEKAALTELLDKLYEAADNLDDTAMEEIMEQLKGYSYPEQQAALLPELENAIADIDVDKCQEIAAGWKEMLG